MAATGASHHDGDLPLYAYPPFSPSFFPSLAKQSKGVLKHPVSQDSESSLEILTKRVRSFFLNGVTSLWYIMHMVNKCIIVLCTINHTDTLSINPLYSAGSEAS